MQPDTATTIRQRFAADFHRPTYHFLPPSNWMNDPNGVIQWQGQYHLFYQHNPFGPLWGNMHWGHAVSADLIHWTDLPLALAPTPGGPDETGCFSGCAVDHGGVPTLIYTGVRGQRHDTQTQCVATSRDGLLTWQKHAGNPVIKDVPPESGQTADFRDPFVWREGNTWYLVLGSRIKDVGGAVFLYRSHNLIDWEYLHPLLTGEIQRNGVIWECPNFFPVDGKWVLIISSHLGNRTGSVRYFVGTFENLRFTPTYEGVLEYGELYAPLTMRDDQGRRVLFGWVRESRPNAEQDAAGWSGVQSIPRLLSVDSHNRLQMRPIPELERHRGRHHHYSAESLPPDAALPVHGLAFDIHAEFEPAGDGVCGVALAVSPGGDEQLDVMYEASTRQLVISRTHTTADGSATTREREVPHTLDGGEPLRLRILLDGSVVEIIANDRTSVTHRTYPARADHNGVQMLLNKAQLRSLDMWEMPSIW